jgi:hypothetical protein
VQDRWRQILNAADRIRVKHLLTLQEGVSPAQMAEMRQAGVKRVSHEIDPRGYRPRAWPARCSN